MKNKIFSIILLIIATAFLYMLIIDSIIIWSGVIIFMITLIGGIYIWTRGDK